MALAVLAGAQLLMGWRWGLNGAAEGWTRVLRSATAVVSHHSLSHYATNMAGAVLLLAAAELLVGRRALLALLLLVIVDTYLFTDVETSIEGASAFVLGSAGLLIGVAPTARRAIAQSSQRRALLLTTVALCGVFVPAAALYVDITGLGADDGIAHAAHIRGTVIGVVLGVGLAVRAAKNAAVTQRARLSVAVRS